MSETSDKADRFRTNLDGFNFPTIQSQTDIIKKFGGLDKTPSNLLDPNLYRRKGVKEGFEVITSGPLKGRIVPKDRPKGALAAGAGFVDYLTEELLGGAFATDLDKLGTTSAGMFPKDSKFYEKGTGAGSLFEQNITPLTLYGDNKEEAREKVDDKTNLELTERGRELIDQELGRLFPTQLQESKDAEGDLNKRANKIIEANKKLNQFERGERRKDTLESTALTIATTPIYTALLEDAAAKRLELDKAMLTAKEMMPSNIQNIMSKKQEQMNLAADSEYRRALGTAAQQTAANQFGAAGIQRSFGNVS